MAFSKTPEQSTYQTKFIKLVKELNNRGSSTATDEDFVNVFPELIKNRNTKEDDLYFVKRPGSSSFISSVGNVSVRGMYYWDATNQLFVAVGGDLRIYNASTGALLTTLLTAFPTTSGHVGFTEFLYDDGSIKVVVTDGNTLQTIDSAGVRIPCTDVDIPIPHLPYPVFLDGYIFIVKSGTADIYNSNLNDPLLYTPGNFLSAEMLPDRATWIGKLNNYLVVAGSQSFEYFWDAGNATASPLQRNDTPVKLTGLIGGISSIGNKIFVVASQNESQSDIFILEDFKLTPIGNESIRRHLSSIIVSDITTIKTSIISIGGHDLFVINTGAVCYCYEIESKLWSRFIWKNTTNFPLANSVAAQTLVGYKTFFSFVSDSTVYIFNPTLYQDDGVNFSVVVVSSNEEFNTMQQKTMSRLTIWADTPLFSSVGLLQWTDDDYATYNSGLSIDLFEERPSINRLGRFRQRAFKFTYTQNQPLRIKGYEVDVNMGTH